MKGWSAIDVALVLITATLCLVCVILALGEVL